MKKCEKCVHNIPHPMLPNVCMKKQKMKTGMINCKHYAWQGDGTFYEVMRNGKKVRIPKGQNDQMAEYKDIIPDELVKSKIKEVTKTKGYKIFKRAARKRSWKRRIRKFIRKGKKSIANYYERLFSRQTKKEKK